MTACRTCAQPCDAKAWEVRTWDLQCPPCRRERLRAWRERRKQEGRPVRNGKSPASYYRDYLDRPGQRERRAARTAVRLALAGGAMVRSACEVCGAPKAEAHHEDYSRPLAVRWLCKPHHVARHLEIKAERSATGEGA